MVVKHGYGRHTGALSKLYKEMGWHDIRFGTGEVIAKVIAELAKFNCICVYESASTDRRPDRYEFATEEDYAYFCLKWS